MRKQPCPKECPDRSGTCHRVCEKYLEYEKEKRQERKERYARLEARLPTENQVRGIHKKAMWNARRK